VLSTSPTLVTPNLGTPSTLVGTNISGTAANLTAGNVTTNANLTGDVTSVGNATTLAASGVVSGSYGSSTAIPTFTVDSKGRLTSASTTSITAGVNTLAYTTASSYATGGSVSGTTLTLAAADATNPGLISTGTQTIAGAKTFNGNLTTAAINATTVTTPIYASTPQTLTSGSTITWNPANGLNASVTLSSSNSTLSFSPTPVSGSYGTLVVTQGTGNNTLTLPTGVTNKVWGSTSNSTIALSTASGAVDIVNFYYDGSSYYWNVSQGYGQNVTSSVLGGTTSNNTAIGYNALLNTTGGNNIAVGYNAGTTNTTGQQNTFIGVTADASANNLSNITAIGYGASVSASNTIQLGNTSISSVKTTGTVYSNGAALTSDQRLKINIKSISGGLSTVMQLNPVHYFKKNTIESKDYSKEENGFIAQEIKKILPFIVNEGSDKEKLLSVDYNSLIPILTKAIQEQQEIINNLQKENRSNSDDIKKLTQQLEKLMKLIK